MGALLGKYYSDVLKYYRILKFRMNIYTCVHAWVYQEKVIIYKT